MLKIEVTNHTLHPVKKAELTKAIRRLLREHRVLRSEINVAIVDDRTIRKLNKKHLRHDYSTDVISFPLSSPDDNGILTGDIIASWETAERISAEIGVPLDGELLLYVVHGTLHLLGMDDGNPSGASEMRSAERECLQHFGYRYVFDDVIADDRHES